MYVNATAFVGLKDQHDLSNVMAFSSCKRLFGIRGAAFVAYKNLLKIHDFGQFYLNFQTHQERRITGPYYAVASLHGVMNIHNDIMIFFFQYWYHDMKSISKTVLSCLIALRF